MHACRHITVFCMQIKEPGTSQAKAPAGKGRELKVDRGPDVCSESQTCRLVMPRSLAALRAKPLDWRRSSSTTSS